jgi:long-subunit fatty acid transport protein
MRSKFSVLLMLILLLTSVNAWCGLNFGPGVEADTSNYFTIQNFFLSPFQLTEYNFLGGGGRARGMGGAFFAISDDPSAASWNPAGLSQIEKPQMLLTFRSYMRRSDFTSTAAGLDFTYSDKLKRDNNALSFASVAIPFKIKDRELVGSVLFQKLADIYKANRYYLIADMAVFENPEKTGYDTLYNYPLDPIVENIAGSLNSVNVSFAGKIYKSLSFGLGINVYGGNFTSDVDFFYPTGDTSGLNGYRFRPHIKSNYSGVNATIGAMYKFDKLSLGAVVKTPFKLKEKNDLKLYTDIIESGVILDNLSILASPFFNTDRKWKIPLMIGIGGAYQLNALTLSADLEYRGYSKTEVTYRRNIANPTDDEVTTGGYVTNEWWGTEGEASPFVSSLEWRNVTQFRIGGEYMVNTKFGKIPLRLGYRNDPQPFAASVNPSEVYLRLDQSVVGGDTSYSPTFIQSNNGPSQGSWVNGNIISLGTGIVWSQIKLDLTLEYATYPDENRETSTAWYTFDRGNKKLLNEIYKHTFTSNETSIHYTRLMISFTGFF